MGRQAVRDLRDQLVLWDPQDPQAWRALRDLQVLRGSAGPRGLQERLVGQGSLVRLDLLELWVLRDREVLMVSLVNREHKDHKVCQVQQDPRDR